MRSVAHQDQIAAIERGYQVSIQWPPKMCAGKVGDAEQVWNGLCPVTNQRSNECLACLGEIPGVIRRLGKALRIELDVPDDVLSVHRQCAHGDATTYGMKFIEVVAGPANCVLALNQSHDFKYLRLAAQPIQETTPVWRANVCLPR